MSTTRVALATTSTAFEQRVRRIFDGALNGDLRRASDDLLVATPSQAVDELAHEGAQVVALGPGISTELALEFARAFDEQRPEISVLVVARPSPELLEAALRAGVRDVLAPDATDQDVHDAFERAMETASRRRVNLMGPQDDARPTGQVITVLSPKGGSGKTTVATNLAVGLSRGTPGNVAILDLDLQFGDVAGALQLEPEHTLADAAEVKGALDATMLKVFLTPHSSMLYALCAPHTPAAGEGVTSERVIEILRLLSEQFPYVVVDTSAGLDEHTLAAVEHSTDLVLLSAMDVPSVRHLKAEIEALDLLGLTAASRHLVLNRADSRVGLDAEDIETTLGLRVDVALPSSRSVPLALNQGRAVIETEPKAPISRQMMKVVERFAGMPALPVTSRRSFRR